MRKKFEANLSCWSWIRQRRSDIGKREGLHASYTPDAPAPAVAELTLGMMLTLLRHVHVASSQLHDGLWRRYFDVVFLEIPSVSSERVV